MSDKPKPGPKPGAPEPRIRFGEFWIPAHLAWKRMEIANVTTDAIERFNSEFPHLATQSTRDVVPLARRRLKAVQVEIHRETEQPDLAVEAAQLLVDASPEDAVAALTEQFGVELDLVGLIQLVGEEAYVDALVREAGEYRANMISPGQTADLWNEAHRPTPGGGRWSARDIERLLADAD